MWFQQIPFEMKERAQYWSGRNGQETATSSELQVPGSTPSSDMFPPPVLSEGLCDDDTPQMSRTTVSAPSASLLHQFQYPQDDVDHHSQSYSSSSTKGSNTKGGNSTSSSSSNPSNGGGGGGGGGGGSNKASSSSGADADSEIKRAERLARNRESARQSRLRKKEFLGQLQDKISVLMEELALLRSTHVEQGEAALSELRLSYVKSLINYLNAHRQENGANQPLAMTSDKELASELTAMYVRTSMNCEERRAVREHQFKEMSDVLSGLEARFLISLMMQPPSFFQEDSNWSLLCRFLKLNPQQEIKVKELSLFMQQNKLLAQEKRRSEMHQKVLSNLQSSTRESAINTEDRWRALCNILTPAQLVVYLDWYSRNSGRISDSKLSERAHDEMLKYCIRNKEYGVGGGLQMGAGLSKLSSKLNTAVHMFEDSIRSKLKTTPSTVQDTSLLASNTAPSMQNDDHMSSSPISVPSLAPFSIANTMNLLTSSWQRSQSSLSSSSGNDDSLDDKSSQMNSNQFFSSRASSSSEGGSDLQSGSNPSLSNSVGGLRSEVRLSQLQSLPTMYRDAHQLSKLKSVLIANRNQAGVAHSHSNPNPSLPGSSSSELGVEDEAFLFKYLQKSTIENVIVSEGKYVPIQRSFS